MIAEHVPCPSCGSTLTVVTTTAGGRRRRICQDCRTAFATFEITAEDYRFMQGALEKLRRLSLPGDKRRARP
jgi:transcriptional regulator NrdR family protein